MRCLRILPALLIAVLLSASSAFASDTLHVVTHQRETVVTDPSTGYRAYKHWGVFPKTNVPVRKINLKVRFGCPDSLRCADWDYLDHIRIRRRGGLAGRSEDAEIARMLTPYGGAFAKDWSFEWTVDVTDFSLWLRDSVEIEYYHSGYEPNNDRGWAITLDFEVILGPPVQAPVAIEKWIDASFAYGDSTAEIGQNLSPLRFAMPKKAAYARLRLSQTGHGMDAQGCGEFCSRYREILLDGKSVDKRNIWRICGDNPLYPQAGTWIYDRANWCPGYLQQPDVYDWPLAPGSAHTVQLSMEPYTAREPSARESIAAWLVYYRAPSARVDAALEEILAPNEHPMHRRRNPVCGEPMVVIRNLGSAPLQRAVILYGVEGFPEQRFEWTGNLAFNQVDTVRIPALLPQLAQGRYFFRARIEIAGDAYPADNILRTAFRTAPVFAPGMVLMLRTNQKPDHNSWELRQLATTNLLAGRPLGSLKAQTLYRDTLPLVPGSYELALRDTAGDGLEFWAHREAGSGWMRLVDGQGRLLKGFEPDCGDGHVYQFVVSADTALLTPPETAPMISLYPTRCTGQTTLQFFQNTPGPVDVEIVTDAGQPVESHHYDSLKEASLSYDLSYRPPQRYYLRVRAGDKQVFNKRIRVVDKE